MVRVRNLALNNTLKTVLIAPLGFKVITENFKAGINNVNQTSPSYVILTGM